jgi:hypothetical protein
MWQAGSPRLMRAITCRTLPPGMQADRLPDLAAEPGPTIRSSRRGSPKRSPEMVEPHVKLLPAAQPTPCNGCLCHLSADTLVVGALPRSGGQSLRQVGRFYLTKPYPTNVSLNALIALRSWFNRFAT